MRFSLRSAGLLLLVAPAVLAQGGLPNLSTLAQPDGAQQTSSSAPASSSASPSPQSTPQSTAATPTQSFPTISRPGGLLGLPTIAGVGIPNQQVPDTKAAPFMQKSDLPDGTVFICVGAILAALAAAVLAWRGLVAWSLHRSVKRAANAQNMADMKAMTAVPGKKRGMYNVVGANSTMSLDHLAAAPIGSSKVTKPYAQKPGGTPPSQSSNSLFFSPTAGGANGMRDSMSRSSTYLPAGYYPSGNAAPAGGSPLANIGGNGQNLSVASLTQPGNRYSHRSGNLPPTSPSLPPSRDGHSIYNRNSVATLSTPGNTRSGVYGYNENMSQSSLSVPGGNAAGGRAPSAYLEDLFENHGTGPRERF